jgi:transcriptional regulator with XRE-family HTH domain
LPAICKLHDVAAQKALEIARICRGERMARETLTGSRIRERRTVAGLRQADLARTLGISASYLNLIEHNRRRIGGKLLLDIARVLRVEPSMLTEGAEAALVASLREAASLANLAPEEAEKAEEIAGRFPGWAEAMTKAYRRVGTLERTVETLTDRLAHDPQLAASMHELLSTAAAVRSTASILADEKDLDTVWRDRFHANINEDSRRLAESAKALVDYFDAAQRQEDAAASPQEEVDGFLEAHDFRFPRLEAGDQTIDELISSSDILRSRAARQLTRAVLDQIVADSRELPLSLLEQAVAETGSDPVELARSLNVPVSLCLRRLAGVPDLKAALVICDRSGSILFRKPAGGLVIPRFGSACALWPLFSALTQPGQVLRLPVTQLGRGRVHFQCFAVADIVGPPVYNTAPLLNATMLMLPAAEQGDAPALEVGSSCRVCPRSRCPARHEPSLLAEEL